MVNMDDMLNNEIGAIVRVKQAGAIQEMSVPFVAGTTLPALQYMVVATAVAVAFCKASGSSPSDALDTPVFCSV